jgi:hypothetical protein
MRYYRKAESAAQKILAAFQTGNLPKALAPMFVRRRDDVPCRSWSWSNQCGASIRGRPPGLDRNPSLRRLGDVYHATPRTIPPNGVA